MSGILGTWNRDGRPVEESLIRKLARTMAHRGPDGCGLWTRGGAGLACQLLRVTPESSAEVQPLVSSSGSVLVFDGRLDNRDELLALLRPGTELADNAPDPALALAAYERFGEQFPGRLAGDFALGLFDPTCRTLLLARDPLGVRPLHYAVAGSTFLFASEIKAILAHPLITPEPNDDMLAECLLGGPGDAADMTCFKRVFSVPPAHVALVSPGGMRVRRYWDFDLTRCIRYPSFEDYIEAFREHFTRAVRRRMRSAAPVVVSVSGGLDSSSILCVAERLKRSDPSRHPAVRGLSYLSADGTPSDEKEFLVAIERDYRIAIGRLPLDRPGLLDGAREEIWHSEAPCLDGQWSDAVGFFRTARELGARTILTGHWADQVLFDQAYLIDLFRRPAWGDIHRHLRAYAFWMSDTDPACFRNQFLRDLVKCLVPDRLHPLLRRLRAHSSNPQWFAPAFHRRRLHRAFTTLAIPRVPASAHARSLYRQVRTSHQATCMEWQNKIAAPYGIEIAFPFLDRDLLSFLMSIPGEIQTKDGVPKALLREAMRGILPVEIVRRRWKADFTHLVNESMANDYDRIVDVLKDEPFAVRMGYIDHDMLRSELVRLKSLVNGHTCEHTWGLMDLLGLEFWLRLFTHAHRPQDALQTMPERPAATAPGGER
jgi:asparagine synthase (glutamine-hydrolysing)